MTPGGGRPELRQPAAVLVLLAVLAGAFLFNVLFLGKSLSGFDVILTQPSWRAAMHYDGTPNRALADSPMIHYPLRQIDWGLLRRGQSAHFNPYIFSGVPSRGQGAGGFVTSVPQLWLNTPNAIDWSTWLRLTLAGFFMYLLLARLGMSQLASLFGAVLWSYNFHQIAWLEFPQHLATELWIPLLFMLNLEVLHGRARGLTMVSLGITAVLFATSGYAQIVLYTLIFIGLYNTAYLAFCATGASRTRFAAWWRVHALLLAALMIVAPFLLFDTAQIQHGLRGLQTFRLQHAPIALSPGTLLHLLRHLLPDIGDLKRLYSPAYLGGIWGRPYDPALYGNLVEGAAYLGILTLPLVILGVIRRAGAPTLATRLLLLALLGLFLGLNHRDPLILALFEAIPFFGYGSFGRSLTIIAFIVCLLAPAGLDALRAALRGRRWHVPIAVLAVTLALPLVVNWLHPDLALRQFVYPVAVLLIAAGLAVLAWHRRRDAWLGGAAIAIAIIDLFAVTCGFNTRLADRLIFPVTPVIARLLADPTPYRVAVLGRRPPYRPNVLAYYGIPSIEGYSTVAPARYLRFMRAAFPASSVSLNGIVRLRRTNPRLLRLLNVKYVITDQPLANDQLELLQHTEQEWLYRLHNPLPRAYCASTLRAPQGAAGAQLAALAQHFDRPLILDPAGLPPGDPSPDCQVGALQAYSDGIDFSVHTGAPSVVAIAYPDAPGWYATINGTQAETRRANGAWLALPVPAGTSHVSLRYRNRYLTVGALCLLIACLAALGLAARLRGATWHRALIVAAALLVAAKQLTALPGIMCDQIPERSHADHCLQRVIPP